MSCSPSLDACPGLDASPSRTTPKRTESDITVAAAKEGHTPLDNESPPRKRQKTEGGGDQAISASSLGAPGSALLDLPLDVLLEILTHVDPLSLRHVSRTSRALRDTLTGPRSNWIWRASYANTDHGLPPAPDDMTVPQFLSLLVDRVCDVCHASPDLKDPLDRIKRIPVHTNPVCDSTQMAREEDMTRFPMVREIQGYFGPQYPLYKIFPASEPHDDRCTYRRYPRVLIQRVANEFLCDTDGKSEEDKKAWIVRREQEYESVIKHAAACHEWEIDEQRKRRAKEEEIRGERLETINQRLNDLNIDIDEPQEFKKQLSTRLTAPPRPSYCFTDKYFPTPVHSTPIEIYDLVREARSLTEEDWTTLQDWLLQAAMAEKRRQLLEGRYAALKQAYYQSMEPKSYREQRLFPSICTLANWDEVIEVIEATPLERHLAANDMRAFVDQLAQARFPQWRAAFEAELVAKLNAVDPECEHPATVADLRLATSVFSPRNSEPGLGEPLRYPELLAWSPRGTSLMHHPAGSYHAVRKCPPWSAHEVQVDVWRSRLAARLVAMAGLDSAKATCADMSRQRVWFARAHDVDMVHRGQRLYLNDFVATVRLSRVLWPTSFRAN
ncbi:hypothetical protein GGF50DRAFT_121307 [Schizophyllum commune]